MGDGGVDVQGLAGLLALFLLREVIEGAHVVEAVGQLDEDDPGVLGHGHEELAEGLGLGRLAALEVDALQLGHPIDDGGYLFAEEFADVLQAGGGVLHHVVQEGGCYGDGVQLQIGQGHRHFQGM